MFTTHSSANYKCDGFLVVSYAQEVVETLTGGYLVRLTRTAEKTYSWEDMTSAAATTCKAAMDAKYMRAFADWTYAVASGVATITQSTVTERKTEVAKVLTPCGSYDVDVTVRETDVKYAESTSATISNPASYFATENARDYDEEVRADTIDGIDRYSGSNIAVSRDLDVTYRVQRRKVNDTGAAFFEYTRFATKTYAFIGMTQAAARNCAKAKVSQYTRDYGVIDSSSGSPSSFQKTRIKTGATIRPRYNGLTWAVDVSVNETDVRASSSSVDPEEMFALENQRFYDGYGNLVLESISRGSPSVIVLDHSFEDFNLANLRLEYREEGSVVWQSVAVTGNPSNYTAILPETGDLTCRLVYDSCESNTIVSEGPENE